MLKSSFFPAATLWVWLKMAYVLLHILAWKSTLEHKMFACFTVVQTSHIILHEVKHVFVSLKRMLYEHEINDGIHWAMKYVRNENKMCHFADTFWQHYNFIPFDWSIYWFTSRKNRSWRYKYFHQHLESISFPSNVCFHSLAWMNRFNIGNTSIKTINTFLKNPIKNALDFFSHCLLRTILALCNDSNE